MNQQSTENQDVFQELDSCMQTIKDMRAEISALQDLLRRTQDTLAIALQAVQSQAPKAHLPAKRGRPRKVDDDSWLLEAFSTMKAEFIAANRLKKPTDGAVLTWYFAKEFQRHGLRESRALTPEFSSKLKRLRNRLGDVRNPTRKTPI